MPAPIEIGNEDSITTIREAVEQHFVDYPSHGSNCSCLDSVIRVLRRGFNPLAYDYEAQNRQGPTARKATNAIHYVIHSAMRG